MKLFVVIFIIVLSSFANLSNAKDRALTDAQICKAGISTIRGQDFARIHLEKEIRNISYFSYTGKDDGVKWKFKCYLDGDQIIWASEMGSWRKSALDSFIEFKVKNDFLVIKENYNSGASFEKKFEIKKIMIE